MTPTASPEPSETLTLRGERWIVTGVAVAFVLLAIVFSLGPIFEGPDELHHYRYVRELVHNRALPDPAGTIGGEDHQPPLYYLLNVPVLLAVDDVGFHSFEADANPYRGYAFTDVGHDNKLVYLHSRPAEAFPWHGVALAVHLMRFIAVALGLATVLISYGALRELWPRRPDLRLLGLGIVAFWPQFVYMTSLVNRDALTLPLAVLAIWLMLRWVRRGPSLRLAVGLGVVLGAAMITKVYLGFLALPMGLAIFMDFKRSWRLGALILALVALIAGWWYARNWIVYGDPLLVKAVEITWPEEVIAPARRTWANTAARLPYVYDSFWARFGNGLVPVAGWLFRFFDAITLLSLGGLIVGAVRAFRKHVAPLDLKLAGIVGAAMLGALGLVLWSTITLWSGNQGRYLLAAMPVLGAIGAFGLEGWTPRRIRLPVALSGALLMAAACTISLFGFFLPAYHVWPVPAHIANPVTYRYGDAATLIGTDTAQVTARPGQTVRLTLYWQAIAPTDQRLLAYLHSVDSTIVRRDSLTGLGALFSTDWRPGERWAENWVLIIPPDAEPQRVYALVAGLYDPQSDANLPITGADGSPATPVVARLAIAGPPSDMQPATTFGGAIGLGAPAVTRSGDTLTVCLPWKSLKPVHGRLSCVCARHRAGWAAARAARRRAEGWAVSHRRVDARRADRRLCAGRRDKRAAIRLHGRRGAV